jgi:hypothetical protein
VPVTDENAGVHVTLAMPVIKPLPLAVAVMQFVALPNVPTLELTVASVNGTAPGPVAVPSPVRPAMPTSGMADCTKAVDAHRLSLVPGAAVGQMTLPLPCALAAEYVATNSAQVSSILARCLVIRKAPAL